MGHSTSQDAVVLVGACWNRRVDRVPCGRSLSYIGLMSCLPPTARLFAVMALLSVALTSCSPSFDYRRTRFQCDETLPCPRGLPCVGNVCGGSAVDASTAAVDATAIDASVDASASLCPTGCEFDPDVEICACPQLRTWGQARDACDLDGLVLLRIPNAEIEADAKALLARRNDGSAWLGGTDAELEGTWRWLEGDIFWLGAAAGGPPQGAFAAFLAEEPNDSGGNEDCIGATSGGWNDVPCSTLLPSFCVQAAP